MAERHGLVDVSLTYRTSAASVRALDRVSLTVAPGSSLSVQGRSGSGKSSLVSVLALMRRPDSGRVLIHGEDVSRASHAQLARIRGREIGMVFQSFHLDPELDALGNVLLPWVFQGSGSRRTARSRAHDLLDGLGIADVARSRPTEMSGGQRQRVAIARAMYPRPALLIADEPTGNLDEETALTIARDLYGLVDSAKTAVVVVTHDDVIASMAAHRVVLSKGSVASPEVVTAKP